MNAVAWMFPLLLVVPLLLVSGLAYVIASHTGVRAEKRKRKSRHDVTSLSRMSKPPLRVYKYRAVELRICDDPCESALAIAGRRLLKSEAPALPLVGCPHKKCMCVYTQYDDRRFIERRTESYPYGMPMGSSGRTRGERRKTTQDRRRSSTG